jgi:outer membrane protein OmpA-like peptidoglycan-associated protein
MPRRWPPTAAPLALVPFALAVVAGAASAQAVPAATVASPAVELHQLHGSPFSDRTLRLDGTNVLPPGKVRVGVDVDDAFRPLVVTDAAAGNRSYALVRQAVGLNLRLAVGLGHRLEVAALVPVTAFQSGETPARATPPATAGLEAVRVGAKARLFGDGMSGAGLGVVGLVALPTGAGGGLIHERGLGAEARRLGARRAGALTVSLGGGVRLRQATQLYDIALGNELNGAAAADYRRDTRTSFFGELAGATPLGSPASSGKQTPLELLLGGRRRFGAVSVFAAAGPGLREGYGTPVLRLVAGASWSDAPLDADHDGIPDDADRCPIVPEDRDGFEDADGCPDPDNDGDGLLDGKDRCPDAAEDKDGFEDADGCPDLDDDQDGLPDATDKCPRQPETKNGYRDDDGCPDRNLHLVDEDKDGVMDDVDKCPKEPEDRDGFEDDDGCPDPDNDKDGFPDAKDACPNEPETINNVKDDDGCPDKGIVTLKEGELETLSPIFFATDRARVRHAFRPTLDEVAAILKAHPEIGRCAIEGHTDATGPAAWNAKLSLDRAKSVAAYLTSKGVDAARVIAIGQGDALPWASNQTAAGRAANRRVLFHIEGVSEDQERQQLELQRERALKEHGAGEPATPTPGHAPASAPAPPPPPKDDPPPAKAGSAARSAPAKKPDSPTSEPTKNEPAKKPAPAKSEPAKKPAPAKSEPARKIEPTPNASSPPDAGQAPPPVGPRAK